MAALIVPTIEISSSRRAHPYRVPAARNAALCGADRQPLEIVNRLVTFVGLAGRPCVMRRRDNYLDCPKRRRPNAESVSSIAQKQRLSRNVYRPASYRLNERCFRCCEEMATCRADALLFL